MREIPMTLVATMEDRMLMSRKEEQIYGTQAWVQMVIKENGEQEWIDFIWPIKDPENVNKRRKAVGFETTMEENAERLGIKYKVKTLDQIAEYGVFS